MKVRVPRWQLLASLAFASVACSGRVDESDSLADKSGAKGDAAVGGTDTSRGSEDASSAGSDAGTSTGADASAPRDAGRGRDASVDSGASSDASAAGPSDAGGSTPPIPTSGCGANPPATGASAQIVSVGGQSRGYHLSVPAGYNRQTPYALIFAYHGLGGKGADLQTFLNMEGTTQGKAIFVYPDGLDVGGGTGWTLSEAGADIKMFDAVLANVSSKFCIDQKAVYAVGFSYGGWMANAVGCYRGNKLGGFASIAGGGPNGKCTGATPAMIVHGSMDTAEPPVAGEESRDFWRTTNGCSATSAAAAPAPCVAFSGCSKSLYWCMHPGGHEIPGFVHDGLWTWFQAQR